MRSPRLACLATFVLGEATALEFPDASFERVFTADFYGDLEPGERRRSLAEARRVAGELVVVDASREHSTVAEERRDRGLRDGSRWRVFKRIVAPEGLLPELGEREGEALYANRWSIAVRAPA